MERVRDEVGVAMSEQRQGSFRHKRGNDSSQKMVGSSREEARGDLSVPMMTLGSNSLE